MTPDVLYASVCDKQARTIILLQSIADAVTEYNARVKDEEDDDKKGISQPLDEDKEDVYIAEATTPGFFAGVFSDEDAGYSESEDDVEDDSEDEEDYSRGVRTFLRNARQRRYEMRTTKEMMSPKHIGIEHRIVGAITFEKTYCKPGEKIIHLTLIAVRKKFRKAGIGKYLLSQIKDMSVVGHYNAVVVHADNSALDFFQRYGFTDDIILNSRWSDLAEQYTNCTLMCYLPPFTNKILSEHSIPELDIIAMENEIKKWREKSLEAYRAEMTCVNRMHHEIVYLRALVSSQQDLINVLTADNEKLRSDKFRMEKQLLDYRLSFTKGTFSTGYSDDEDDIPGEKLIKELEREVGRSKLMFVPHKKGESNYMLNQGALDEPYDHGKDAQDFYKVTYEFDKAFQADNSVTTQYQIQMISKAILPASYIEHYKVRQAALNDPSTVTRLYFCGGSEKSQRMPEILQKGFSEQDMTHGDYGRGLYFSKYPSKAAVYAPLGLLVLAEVSLGTTETVVTKNRARISPTKYFDSIITPGRLCSDDVDDQMLYQEYVIFDIHQALPLYLITYSPAESRTVFRSSHSKTKDKQ